MMIQNLNLMIFQDCQCNIFELYSNILNELCPNLLKFTKVIVCYRVLEELKAVIALHKLISIRSKVNDIRSSFYMSERMMQVTQAVQKGQM